jgi:uncharacterized protein
VSRVLPVDDDLDTGPFFAAARRGELAVQRCAGCEAVLHVPKAYCHHCGSWETRWDVVPGHGDLRSWTVVTHQVHPAFPVPYTVVLVTVEGCGITLVGSLPGRPELTIGQPMEVWFEELDEGVVLPNWRPA